MPTILAVESSCDDTGASVIINGKVASNIISSQKIHSNFGGVVPELASRDHQKNIVYVVENALIEAKTDIKQIDAVAVTAGPGLLGSLLVGLNFAKGICLANNIPLIEVNHIEAHILAHFIDKPKPNFPFLCLLVSGGHTQIVQLNTHLESKILAKTIDDAAGEAFDKGAKILGLPYPGGPIIDQLAKNGNPLKYHFKLPNVDGNNYSFSGLKTALLYFLRDEIKHSKTFIEDNLPDLCASWQYTIVKYLIQQFKTIAKQQKVQHIGIAGGVAANSLLRNEIQNLANELDIKAYIPKFEYCLDNAGMIAQAAWYKYQNQDFSSLDIMPYTRVKP